MKFKNRKRAHRLLNVRKRRRWRGKTCRRKSIKRSLQEYCRENEND